MQLSDEELSHLNMLLSLLRNNFTGARFGSLLVNDAANALDKALSELQKFEADAQNREAFKQYE